MNRKIDSFTKEGIIEVLNNSKSFREAIINFGYSSNGSGGYITVKSHLKKLNIHIPKYHYYGENKTQPKFLMTDILIQNSLYTNRTQLKKRLVKDGLLEYKCRCGNTGMWEGKKLTLQLEHKNGINNDNRIENLEFLCPNCHSQSKTFSGRNSSAKKQKQIKEKLRPKNYCKCGALIKNRSKICPKCHHLNQRKISNRPSYDELMRDIEALGGYSATGRKYNVSDNTIRKWLHMYHKMN